jgi:hypothetical protein
MYRIVQRRHSVKAKLDEAAIEAGVRRAMKKKRWARLAIRRYRRLIGAEPGTTQPGSLGNSGLQWGCTDPETRRLLATVLDPLMLGGRVPCCSGFAPYRRGTLSLSLPYLMPQECQPS